MWSSLCRCPRTSTYVMFEVHTKQTSTDGKLTDLNRQQFKGPTSYFLTKAEHKHPLKVTISNILFDFGQFESWQEVEICALSNTVNLLLSLPCRPGPERLSCHFTAVRNLAC